MSELPSESALARAQKSWTVQDELLATLIEVVDGGNRQLFQAALAPYMKDTPKAWDPVRVPRPSTAAPEPEPPKRPMSIADIRAAFLKGGLTDE